MKKTNWYHTVVAGICGALSAWLWLAASAQWAIYFDMRLLFPVLRRTTGINGPWMVGVSDILFAIISASLVAILLGFILKPLWWRASASYLLGFYIAQIVIGAFNDESLAYLATYLPFWLFMGWFALCGSILSRRLEHTRPKEEAKPTGHKKPWPMA